MYPLTFLCSGRLPSAHSCRHEPKSAFFKLQKAIVPVIAGQQSKDCWKYQGLGSPPPVTLSSRCSVTQLLSSSGRIILSASFWTISSSFPQCLASSGPLNSLPLNNSLCPVSICVLFSYQSSLHCPNQLFPLESLTQSWLWAKPQIVHYARYGDKRTKGSIHAWRNLYFRIQYWDIRK